MKEIKPIKPRKMKGSKPRLSSDEAQIILEAATHGDHSYNTLLVSQFDQAVAEFYDLDPDGDRGHGDEELSGVKRDDLVGKIKNWSRKRRKKVLAACMMADMYSDLTLEDVGLVKAR